MPAERLNRGASDRAAEPTKARPIDGREPSAGVDRRSVAYGPAALLRLQRVAGNAVVRRLLAARAGVIQRDDVVIEDVPDEPAPSREPQAVPEPSSPLLLTDRPWAEIEAERAMHSRVTVEDVPDEPRPSREPVPVPEPTSPLLLTDRPWAEIEQERDPRWQGKIQELGRPEAGPFPWSRPEAESGGRPLPAGMKRRRHEKVAPAFHERDFTESRAAEREGERAATAPQGGFAATKQALEGSMAGDALAQEARRLEAIENAAAEAPVNTKLAGILKKASEAKKAAGIGMVGVTQLEALDQQHKELKAAKRWAPLSDVLDQMNDEAAKVLSYTSALTRNGDRITKLDEKYTPSKKKYELRTVTFQAFQLEVQKKPRNDAAALTKLTALENAIQAEEDKKAAALAASNAAAAEQVRRQNLRTQGRWPGNNIPTAEIAEATRATLGGSDEERAAVVEALDALKDASKSHSWARKWDAYHGNGEGNLPGIPGGGGYKEYYVRPNGGRVGIAGLEPPGARRLVKNDTTGFVYYSDNHYGDPNGTTLPAFVKVTDA